MLALLVLTVDASLSTLNQCASPVAQLKKAVPLGWAGGNQLASRENENFRAYNANAGEDGVGRLRGGGQH